jgi:hypothetical protein
MDLKAIHLDDREAPRALLWQRDPDRQERIEVREVYQPPEMAVPVRGLEAVARRWGTCAGCGQVGQLIPDPLTPGCEWCEGCSE